MIIVYSPGYQEATASEAVLTAQLVYSTESWWRVGISYSSRLRAPTGQNATARGMVPRPDPQVRVNTTNA